MMASDANPLLPKPSSACDVALIVAGNIACLVGITG